MRIGRHGYEIELYRRRENWLWVVFDEDGDEIRFGHARDRAGAMGQAHRAIARLRSPFTPWLEWLASFSPKHV